MILEEETLIEIEDYINHLEEVFGLRPETMEDFAKAIAQQRKLNKLFEDKNELQRKFLQALRT